MTNVIGIDGGGTKTEAVMADTDGIVLARAAAGPTNPNLISGSALQNTFRSLLRDLADQAPGPFKNVKRLFAGISGAALKQSGKELLHILEELLPADIAIQVEPDTINALYSGTYGEPGIVQIAGTGSITYGVNNQLEHGRVGGWGYLFGDEGSGFDIGRQGVVSVLKALDGRDTKTMLTEMLCTYFNVTNEYELIRKIYKAPAPKSEISPLSKIVFDAYKKEDPAAVRIIGEAVDSTCFSILTLYKKLFDVSETVKVILSGGVFNEEIMSNAIKENFCGFTGLTIYNPIMPPVGGSLIGAYLINGSQPDEAVTKNIGTSLQQ